MPIRSTVPVSLITVALLFTLMLLTSGCSTIKNKFTVEEGSKQVEQQSALKDDGQKWKDKLPKEGQPLQKIFQQMFPGLKFSLQGNRMVTANGETYFIEQVIFGYFVRTEEEFMVIVRRPPEELAHAMGFYHAYLGIFDAQSRDLISPIKLFTADEGSINLYKGQNHRTYILFTGSVTFQGWSEWNGGLYRAAADNWEKAWPEQEDFWKNKAVQAGQDRIILYDRKIIEQNGQGVIPEYQFIYNQELLWDPFKEGFN